MAKSNEGPKLLFQKATESEIKSRNNKLGTDSAVYNNDLAQHFDDEDVKYIQTALLEVFRADNQPDTSKFHRHQRHDLSSPKTSCKSASLPSCSAASKVNFTNDIDSVHSQYVSGMTESQQPDVNAIDLDSNNIKRSDDSDSGYQSISSVQSPEKESTRLFNDILKFGVDEEDIYFLKQYFCSLIPNDEHYWIRRVSWVDHPPTTKKSDDSVNESGCLRTEGFSKVERVPDWFKGKSTRTQLQLSTSNNITSPYNKRYKSSKKGLCRQMRNYHRSVHTAYQSVSQSNLLKFNSLKFRKKKLRLDKSKIHGYGLFAAESIPPNEVIIEYVGQLIRPIIADLREKVYRASGIGSFCFKLDNDTVIDATKYGNMNRFVNHSCCPNSYAKILVIDGRKKIVLYSRRQIGIDEEITVNYKMPYEDDKIMCLCNLPECKKWLN